MTVILATGISCFQAPSQNCEKQLLTSSCLSVCPSVRPSAWNNSAHTGHHHHHYHVQEGLGLIPVPCILKMKLVPPSLPRFGRPMCLRPFGLYCSACLGILFVSILCMCCSHFSWYCFISFTIFAAPVFFPNSLWTAKVACPLGNAAQTAADGRGCRRKSSALKLGPFS